MRGLDKAASIIDGLVAAIGRWSSWFNTGLVLLIASDVFLRYAFNETSSWIIELEWHFFALIFLLGSPYALLRDEHVRVDVLYTRFSKRRQALVNFVGSLVLLLPWCLVVIKTSFFYAENAYVIGEGSAEPDGLPARYIIKFAITVGFILLLLQGISEAIKSGAQLFGKTEEDAWKS